MSHKFSLDTSNAIKVSCSLAREALAVGDTAYRQAAEHIFQATQQNATQRQIAAEIGKPLSTVNQLLTWHKSGYQGTPFSAISKAKRERARVRPVEHPPAQSARVDQEQLDAANCRAEIAKAESAKARADVEKASMEASRAEAEARQAKAEAATAEADARTARARANNPSKQRVHSGPRDLLVKALGMLGSDQIGERDNAVRVAEAQRKKLGMTWDDLILPAVKAEARRAA